MPVAPQAFSAASLILAVATGTVGTICLTSASQVWEYPFPRALLLMSGAYFLFAALMWGLALFVFRLGNFQSKWPARIVLISFAFAPVGLALWTSFWGFVFFQDLHKTCARPQEWECNVSHENATTEQLRRIDDALKWYRGVNKVERPH